MELRSILFLFLELVLTIVFGIYHDVCIYNYLNFSVNYVHKSVWLKCRGCFAMLCVFCVLFGFSAAFFICIFFCNSELVFYLILKYSRRRSLWTSPSWRTAWVEAALRMWSCSFFLLKMALQPLTVHWTAFSWQWHRCRTTWHLWKQRNSEP